MVQSTVIRKFQQCKQTVELAEFAVRPHPAAAPSDHSPGTTSFSTSGAYNGTGIAVFGQGRARNLTSAQPENDSDEENSLLVVFQHHTGELRWMQHLWPDTWRGGSTNEVIASDAKNGTPISVREGPYPIGTMETHVFCQSSPSVTFDPQAMLTRSHRC